MIEKLRRNLARRNRKSIIDASRVPSAVILPVFCKNGEYCILFTKRTETVADHKGQVSFPGGRYEDDDKNLLETALRECTEEIGVPADEVEILGQLDDFTTITSNYIVSVFVGLIPYPYDFKIDPNEIARPIEVPISVLRDADYQQEKAELFAGLPLPVYRYGSDVIWGATARILSQFLEIWTQIRH